MTSHFMLNIAVPDTVPHDRTALLAMLEARSVAIVGASDRPGSFGARMVAEVGRSASGPVVYPVNPRHREVSGLACFPSLADLPEPADLVLLGVPDAALDEQLSLAASVECRSAVIFGNAADPPLRQRLAATARSAGLELCGAGCMGFANVSYGLRAMGYLEPDPLPAGPVALVTHSGSMFSALLRCRRAFGFTIAVSSGQELVTTAASYLSYALEQPETRVIALALEAIRDADALRAQLALAAERDLPVVLLTVGQSARGQVMVTAHSGALAGSDGAWEALTRAYGLHRVGDIAELADTLELFSLVTRRRTRRNARGGIATVHDSGFERAHLADLAERAGVPLAQIGDQTKTRLAGLLDPGLEPVNPLDVWGTGKDTRQLFGGALAALAADDAVDAVALAVDLVPELDHDDSYRQAVLDAALLTTKPLVVISNLPSAIDEAAARRLRCHGIPVLEGTRSGLLALRHLLDPPADPLPRLAGHPRRRRALGLVRQCGDSATAVFALLREYGISCARAEPVTSAGAALAAAERIGYPVVLKTDEPGVAHKSDVHGVILNLADGSQVTAAYDDLAARLGPAALVCETTPPGVELALGIVRDPALGPLIVAGTGGILVELIADRAVALPPLSAEQAADMLGGLKISKLLAGVRGSPPADLFAVASAISGLSELAIDLADHIQALDINPLICGPNAAIAADALVVTRSG
jgi:acetate---CoA ligase (ADP-forming)